MNWEQTGQAILGLGLAFWAMFQGWKGFRKSDGKPPVDRPPNPHELKETLAELKALVEQHHNLTQQNHATSERNHEDLEHAFSELTRQLDRIEASFRLDNAMKGLRRELGG